MKAHRKKYGGRFLLPRFKLSSAVSEEMEPRAQMGATPRLRPKRQENVSVFATLIVLPLVGIQVLKVTCARARFVCTCDCA